MDEFTPEQQTSFDVEINRLRDRLSLRKAVMALPTLKQRDDAIGRLRLAVVDLMAATQDTHLPLNPWLSIETHAWLEEAPEVAKGLGKGLGKGHLLSGAVGSVARPNEHREWLIGEQIPHLCEKVYGAPFANTLGGWSMRFAHHVLKVLGEKEASDETIKTFVSKSRLKVRTRKTRTQL
jgi:hypothetical protein